MNITHLIAILTVCTGVTLTTAANAANNMAATEHLDSIVLGSGCFWGAEKRYEAIEGVVDAVSGYADGKGVKPTYREIIKFSNKRNPDNHAEVVKEIYGKQGYMSPDKFYQMLGKFAL